MSRRLLIALGLVAVLGGCGSGTTHPGLPESASPARGKMLIEYYGCGACHVIGGIATADGRVGPPLTSFTSKRLIAGVLPNTPANVVRWIVDPPRVSARTDMPALGIGRQGALAIVAYLEGQ